jgi:23S rRNA U2552 (ribose-2'-O)-methylase RlmE/FtsJ
VFTLEEANTLLKFRCALVNKEYDGAVEALFGSVLSSVMSFVQLAKPTASMDI